MLKANSFRSDSSAGYHTADEAPIDRERSVTFSNTVQEHTIEEEPPHHIDHIDLLKYRAYFKRPELGSGLPARVFRRYPRTYACGCGIVIPVWILVLLSLLCGKFLGELESPIELDANDAAMRARKVVSAYNEAVSDTLSVLPTLCYFLYQNRTNLTEMGSAFMDILEDHATLNEYIEAQPNLTGHAFVDVTRFGQYMDECGKAADEYTNNIQYVWFGNTSYDGSDFGDQSLSFNWNRCMNEISANSSNRIFSPNQKQINASKPQAQQQAYMDEWNRHFDELRQKNLLMYIEADENNTVDDSRMQAFQASLEEATGRTTCTVNIAAAGWFWFTVMTTVGYGNQAPSSAGGRAMVFTAGFLCILFFGAVLATSGTIISHIVFDIVYRLRIKILLRKQVMMLIWGLFWCIYMIGMSAMFMKWAWDRLGEDIAWQDAYWFSYISTTTVGLGDYYQAPQALFIVDLLVFALAYLFGFVLVSAFLAELGLLLAQHVPNISDELGKRLQHVGVTNTPGLLDGSQQSSGNSMQEEDGAAAKDTEDVDALPETHPEDDDEEADKSSGHFGVEDKA